MVYEISSFMIMRNSVVWRWSHTRHHTDTIIVGRDPEIVAMRPPQMIIIALNVFGIVALPQSLFAIARNAVGHLSADERRYVPEPERARAVWTARAHVAVYLAAIAWAVLAWSWLPLMLIGLPRAYGIWLLVLMALPQHAGLDEDDHSSSQSSRLTCRHWRTAGRCSRPALAIGVTDGVGQAYAAS